MVRRHTITDSRQQYNIGNFTFLAFPCQIQGVRLITGNSGREGRGVPVEIVVECDDELLPVLRDRGVTIGPIRENVDTVIKSSDTIVKPTKDTRTTPK